MATARNSNEKIALEFFSGLSRGDADVVRAQISDDLVWTPMIKGAPTYDSESVFTQLLPYLRNLFAPGDPQYIVSTVTSAQDLVVVETRCTGRVKSSEDRVYENDYCWVLEVSGGKIRAIREYLDVDTVRAFFA
jgi:ketosteroid isomerase-like protein